MRFAQPANFMSVVLASGLFAIGVAVGIAVAREPAKRFEPLLATSKTVMDEPIHYPSGGPAKLTTGILTMDPGDETGWHTHGAPLTGLVLEGELTVDYGDKGKRVYSKGQSIAEAMSVPHNGKNAGNVPMRLFVVFVGAEGLANTTPLKQQP